MNATGKRRLLKLADFLETAKLPGEFDLRSLATEASDGRPACGSTACALGWGASIPSFRRAGYHLTKSGHLRVKGVRAGPWRWPAAAALFFSISTDDATDTFCARLGPEPNEGPAARKAVVKRIRRLVKRAA